MSNQNSINKVYLIQNLKAIAIIIVVFGHSIIIYSNSWGFYTTSNEVPLLNSIKNFINIFQMPLFFSISGFLFAKTFKKYNFVKLVINKFKRLIIPFFCISLLWMIPIKSFLGYRNYANVKFLGILKMLLLNIDSGHLWYLPTLFIMFIIMYVLLKIFKENRLLIILILIIYYFSNNLIYSNFFVLALKNLIYFYMGIIFSKQKNELNIKNITVLIVLLILSLNIYYRFHYTYLLVYIAILLVKLFFILLPNKKIKFLDILADNSFGIYLLHSPLVYVTFTFIPNCHYFYIIFINFIAFGWLSLILTTLVRKTKFKFILGN